MSLVRRTLLALVAVAALLGCAAKRLPPGTPPPEYETRELPPWSGDAPDAGTDADVLPEPAPVPEDAAAPSEQPKTEPPPLDAGAGPSPDAGVR
jgi:hypothetical protein